LVIVGGGETAYTKSLQLIAQRLAPALPKIDWIGEVWGSSRWPYFQGAELFCLPSYSENFGLAVLEACQVGTPALTTDTTPWGDWLSPNRGFIVEPNVDSVARGLKAFFAQRFSPEQRNDLAAWTREAFSWEALAPRYERLYRELVSRRSN
jgi:glycosyltransferase involved in cell wall biosynthesis